MKKIFLIVASVLVIITALAYFGGGYVVYEQLSKAPVMDPATANNTPANFKVTYSEYANFDPSPYFVSSYQNISFSSRQPGIMLSGWYMESDPNAPVVIVTH